MLTILQNTKTINFSGNYTAKQICTELCGGACCNHSTPMSAKLKSAAERFYANSIKTAEDSTKSPARLDLHNWLCLDPRGNFINNKSQIYLDQLFQEKDAGKRAQILNELEKINMELQETCGSTECFVPITNPNLANRPEEAFYPTEINPCIFKDHGNTNECKIYNGIEDEKGEIIPRPTACIEVGSDNLPCPWLNPEKYTESVLKTREMFARQGYGNIPIEACQQHVSEQFNLNETFLEKIWKPFQESLRVSKNN